MYTLCPHCSTCFRITSEQINAAQGNVRCGNCGAVFNALDNPAPEPEADLDSPFSNSPPLSSNDLFQEQGATLLEEETEIPFNQEDDTLHLFEEPQFVPLGEEEPEHSFFDEPDLSPTGRENGTLPTDEKPISVPLPDDTNDGIHEYFVDDVENTTIEELEKLFLPEEEEEEEKPPTEPPSENALVPAEEPSSQPAKQKQKSALLSLLTSPVVLSIGSLLLIVLLFGQYLYFARDHLAQRYAELRPLLESMCNQFGCTLPLRRDLSKLQITHRDVRTHPTVKEALLINATFVNRAPFRQPYPAIELKLSNIHGKLIGKRIFQPEEYLAGHPDIEAGIPPDTQVYLVLELADPGREAVNFEFNFR